jgi:phospholipid/cholesterol/gamma-HCH transport system substrate-binding protein
VKRSSEAMVGVVIVAAVLVVTVGTLWLQGATLRAVETDLTAAFDNVGLIRPGNAVKLRGVRIGRVQEIVVEPGGRFVRVHMRVNEDIPLPDDAVAVLAPESLFGDWQVEIVSRDQFPEHRYHSPDDPDDLPGYSIPDLSQLTATADRISADIEVLTERVGIAFSEETARNIASLIDNVEEVTQRLSALVSQQADAFAGVTDEVRDVAREIGYAASEARESFERVSETLAREELARSIEDLAVVMENVRDFSGGLEGTAGDIRELAARADSTLTRIESVMAQVEEGEGSIARLLRDPTMATEMEGALQQLHLLLEDIRENPRRYLRLSIF